MRLYKRKFLTIPRLPPIPRENWTSMLLYLIKNGVTKACIRRNTGMSNELIYRLLDPCMRPGKLFYVQGLRLKQLVAYVESVTPVQQELEIENDQRSSEIRESAVTDDETHRVC